MATGDKLIQVKDLKKYYNRGAIKALDGVTVDIDRGDVMVVIGPSGSGKSTFLRSLEPAGRAHRRLPSSSTGWTSPRKKIPDADGKAGEGGHRPAPPEDGHGVPALQPLPPHDHSWTT